MSIASAKNQFAVTYADKRRAYMALLEKRIWTATDIKAMEDLTRQLNYLRVLAGVK